jgi:hypothetical protein
MTTQTSLLVNYEDVYTRMQLETQLAGLAADINSAIIGAQLHLQTVLESNFDLHTYNALFLIDDEAFSGVRPNNMFRLELPTGLISKATPPVVTYGSAFDLSDQAALPPAQIRVDYDRGYIELQAPLDCSISTNRLAYLSAGLGTTAQIVDVSDCYIQVLFTAGFAGEVLDETEDPPTIVTPADPIPDWLYEGILSYTPVIFNISQTTNRSDAAGKVYATAGDSAMAVIAPYLRKKGLAYRCVGFDVLT